MVVQIFFNSFMIFQEAGVFIGTLFLEDVTGEYSFFG